MLSKGYRPRTMNLPCHHTQMDQKEMTKPLDVTSRHPSQLNAMWEVSKLTLRMLPFLTGQTSSFLCVV